MSQELVSVSQVNKHLVRAYEAKTEAWAKALIAPGQDIVSTKLATLSAEEVDAILMKLDMLAPMRQHSGIAAMLAEEADSILTAVRMVKTETKEAFRGILGAGAALDICWLRAKDVGGPTLNSAHSDNKAVWGQTVTYPTIKQTWTYSFTAGTSVDMIPSQTMIEEAGIVLLGFIDPIEKPPVGAVQITISAIPCPPQSLNFRITEEFGTYYKLPFCRLEKPVIIGPEKLFQVAVNPDLTGSGKCMPLALLITTAEKMLMT